MRPIVLKVTEEVSSVTVLLLRPGIGSQDLQEIRCQIAVLLNTIVVRMRQVIWLAGILQWRKALSRARCVSIGPPAVVNGLSTSGYETVGLSMCTSCPNHPPAIWDSVETGEQVKESVIFVRLLFWFCSFRCLWVWYSQHASLTALELELPVT